MKQDRHLDRARRIATLATAMLLAVQACNPAWAGSREQARRLHDRLAGVPPTDAVLTQMAADIDANNATAAAQLARPACTGRGSCARLP